MSNTSIRNIAIIAHVDHGKTTLVDAMLRQSGLFRENEETAERMMDSNDLERERGITILAKATGLTYGDIKINIIDTPGHSDFGGEVERALKIVDGVMLLVDASEGPLPQTRYVLMKALEARLPQIVVINKIDRPDARIQEVLNEVYDLFIDLDASEDQLDFPVIYTNGKAGIAKINMEDESTNLRPLFEEIIKKIPAPKGDSSAPLKALLFDSWYDQYQGVIILVRLFDGTLKKGDKIQLMSTNKAYEALKVGIFSPVMVEVPQLTAGEVGFVIAGIKDVADAKVGDTVTLLNRQCLVPLDGFKEVKPMVFSGLYPIDTVQYEQLRDALAKLKLNDSSFSFDPETSVALGFGFRCGFLGLLHMEIIQERLEREFGLELITTAPTVVYRVHKMNGEVFSIQSANQMPELQSMEYLEEPFILAHIHVPNEFVGGVLALCEDKRGVQREIKYLTPNRVMIIYELPLNEIVLDFYDRLKSITKGYASLDYEHLEYRRSDLVRMNVLINGEVVDALSLILHREKAYFRGRDLVAKMKELISRQMFEVAIQAAIGNKVIARETVKAMRKDVLAKCYGGDITRKRKLLEKQKEGKKRMKNVGNVELPQEAFLAILKVD